VPAAPPIKYGLGYKSRTLTLNPNLNPNPETDPNPNPKSNKHVCSTKRHRNKIRHKVIYISYFRWAGSGYTKGLHYCYRSIYCYGSGSMGHTYMMSHTLDGPVHRLLISTDGTVTFLWSSILMEPYPLHSLASGGLCPPDPLPGLRPWTPLGDSGPPDPLWFCTPIPNLLLPPLLCMLCTVSM